MPSIVRFIIGTLLFSASYLIVAIPTNSVLLGILAVVAALANRIWGFIDSDEAARQQEKRR
jgi:hypothetical protein